MVLAILFSVSTDVSAQSKAARLAKKAAELKAADTNIAKVHMSEDRETPYMIVFDQESEEAYQFSDAQSLIEQKLDLRKNVDKIKFHKSIPLPKLGLETQRFEQYYNGIKVEHGDYVATGKGEKLVAINGEYYELEGINVAPSLDEETALQQAIKWVGAESYAHDYIMENYNGVYAPDVMSPWYNAYKEYYPTGELVIVDDYNTKAIDQDLAWKFNIYATHPRSRGYIYVNAHTGKVMLNDPIIKHWQATGTPASQMVSSRYADDIEIQTTKLDKNGAGGYDEPNPLGDVTLGSTDLNNSQGVPVNEPFLLPPTDVYVLIDQSREVDGSGLKRVETYDVNGAGGAPLSAPIYGQARSFTDLNNTWTREDHVRGLPNGSDINPTLRQYDDDIAWDAHWGAGVVYDYWTDQHGRDSYDDAGAPIRSYVHIGNAYDNAFWNGSVMSYGDGQSFKSLTSLDVCGHEVGHAVCTFTSNLVYAKQSGGMNEGFSDIWAATTEYYQINRPGGDQLAYHPTDNPDGMRPFGIGEQIETSGDDANGDQSVGALRWMDSPKVEGNPDTFGGDRWQETEACEPSLANDQCGVHGNSGVLNKWFYLMTIGSGANPDGPDKQYVGTGANVDDEMRDDAVTGSNNTIPYKVERGLGFKIAEQIAFGAEVLLTSNGTFDECRIVSILVAQEMANQEVTTENGTYNFNGGPCEEIVKIVTNAWHGVGVGTPFATPCEVISIGFLGQSPTVVEAGENNVCDDFQTLTIPYFTNNGTLAPTTHVLIIDPTSTATEGKDFIIENKNFSTTAESGYQKLSFDIKIINDALIEEEELLILGFTGSTSTQTIRIKDNDVAPTIGTGTGLATLFSEDFESGTYKFTIEDPRVGEGPNRWYLGLNGGGITQVAGNMAYVGLQPGSDAYEGNQGNNELYLISDKIDARGIIDVQVSFDWGAGGERDAGINAAEFDFGRLDYSFDGTTFFPVADAVFVGDGGVSPLIPASGNYNEMLSFLDGKEFYLGYRWFNDPLVGAGGSFSIDNVLVQGKPSIIESEEGHGKVARVDQGEQIFFLSTQDGGVIADISVDELDGNLGCVDASVVATGDGTSTYDNGIRSNKIFSIENSSNTPYTITLYYTAAEVAGFDDPMTVNIIKATDIETESGAIINTNTTRTPITDPSDNSIIIGYKYTGTFSGFSEFALVSQNVIQDALAVELTNLTATAQTASIQLDWTTATETDNKGFEVQRQVEGTTEWAAIGFVQGQGNTSTGHAYQFTDRNVKNGVTYLYRLAQLDVNNAKTLSNVVSAVIDGQSEAVSITPNPAVDHVTVAINTTNDEKATVSLLSISGQVLNVNTNAATNSNTRVDLVAYPSGIYFIKVETTQGATVQKVVKR